MLIVIGRYITQPHRLQDLGFAGTRSFSEIRQVLFYNLLTTGLPSHYRWLSSYAMARLYPGPSLEDNRISLAEARAWLLYDV
jgi:hypothetical protein